MKHPRRKPVTPRSQVRSALRNLWMRSRERAAALKRESYTCETCKRKKTTAKGREFDVLVHHRNGIDWDGLIDLVIERMLPDPSELEVVCPECHEKIHEK